MIISNNFKTIFLNEESFILEAPKAYFVKFKDGLGFWINKKLAVYGKTGSNGKKYYSIRLNKTFTYEIYKYQIVDNKLKNETKPFVTYTGKEFIEEIFLILKNDKLSKELGVSKW